VLQLAFLRQLLDDLENQGHVVVPAPLVLQLPLPPALSLFRDKLRDNSSLCLLAFLDQSLLFSLELHKFVAHNGQQVEPYLFFRVFLNSFLDLSAGQREPVLV
jgi:hypothetical protein